MYDPHYGDGRHGEHNRHGGNVVIVMFIIAAIIAIAGVLVWATSSKAADIGSMKDTDNRDRPLLLAPAKAAPGVASWTGIWAAALASYNMSNSELNFDIFGETEEGRETVNLAHVDGFGGEGWSGDLQLGGDVQIGRFVLGAFGEYSFGGVESQVSVFEGAARLDVEQQDGWAILGRLGISTEDNRTLFYGAAGWACADVEAKIRAGDESASRDFDFCGIPAEIGVEHKFTDNVRGKLAARYTWYDEETVLRFGDDEFGGRLTAEPGVFSVKAGVVISTTGGLGIFSGN